MTTSRLLLQPISLADRLEAVRHRHLNLSATGHMGGNRPDLHIWPAENEDVPPAVVTVSISAMFGEQARHFDVTPDEADILAHHLIETAKLVRREVAAAADHQLVAAE